MKRSEARRALGLEEEPRACDPLLEAAIGAAPLSEHEREILRYLGEQGEASPHDIRQSGRLRVRRAFVMGRASHPEIQRLLEGLELRGLVAGERDAGHPYLWIWRLVPDTIGVLGRLVLEVPQ